MAHAIVTGLAVFAVIWAMTHFGIVTEEERKRWSWKLFLGVFAVIFAINLLWPGTAP